MNAQTLKPNQKEYTHRRDWIDRENRKAIRLLWYTLVPLGVVNMVAQSVISARAVSIHRSLLILFYSILLAVLEQTILPKKTRHATALLYLVSAPVFVLGCLLGTVWDPGREGTTILLLLVILPIFVLDHPLRMAAVSAGWLALFLALSLCFKGEALFRVDSLHGIEFYLASLVIYTLIHQVRLKYLQNLETAAYERDHDAQTGSLSRRALSDRLNAFPGADAPGEMILLIAGMEQQQLYRDYLGSAASDAMLRFFSDTLTDVFGRDAVYRFAETEFACLGCGETVEAYLEKLERCRDVLHGFQWNGRTLSLELAAGYVTGTPASAQNAQDMLRLANIYAHKARRMGHDQTVGGAFDGSALASGIHQSVLLAGTNDLDRNRLTDLPDLSYFVSHADVLLRNLVDHAKYPMVGYIKLQHLRDYNNRYGYEKGDDLLVEMAELLRRGYPDRYLCHITGGQFCVLCYGNEAEPGLATVREGLRHIAADTGVSCRAGFAAHTGTESAISLLDRAASAYESIRESKERSFRYYDRELSEEMQFRDYIANHIDEAIASGWLKVYYQPIIRSITSEVCNEEALCRWDDPRYGLLSPGRFIPVLEERGLICKTDLFVVRQVLQEFRLRREQGVPIVPVSVNLSRRDFDECDMVAEICSLVDAAGEDRSLIKIEITESAFVTDQDMLKNELRRFHANGFDIWMDDFGSEYSTLNLMQELDFDLIKIDMKFMENFTPDARNYVIVSKIIDMARGLGVSTLIEGVETKEQLRIMQILGCEKIQGFLFNSPHPLSYISRRAREGTGLTFEASASAAYYETVGRVNLNEPMASADGRKNLLAADIMPAGVIELREGRVFCLRGTNAFLRQLERWGYLSAEEDDTRIREVALPKAAWGKKAMTCMDTEDWVSFTVKTETGRNILVYLRRLGGVSWRGGTAILTVLLPEVKL